MLALPRGLEAQAQELGALSEELRGVLVPWIHRLLPLFGSQNSVDVETGLPNGYDGVHSRGQLEQLLAAEWLWAEVEPLEFLRRAAQGEQLFLRRAFENPAAGRQIFAVFDTGPSQLGAPRIAHLALLYVLAAWSSRNHAQFTWGTLHTPGLVHHGASKEGLRTLLDSRTLERAGEARFAQWQEHIAATYPSRTGGVVDVWWIGAAPPNARCAVQIHNSTAPDGVQHLEVSVRAPQRLLRRLQLAVPPLSTARRLLTDPFDAPTGMVTAVRLSHTASRVLLRTSDGRLVVSGPREEREGSAAGTREQLALDQRRWGGYEPLPDEEIVSADHSRGATTVLCYSRGKGCLRVWRGTDPSPRREVPITQLPAAFVPPDPGSDFLPFVHYAGQSSVFVFVDANGTLFSLETTPRVLATRVMAFAAGNHGFTIIRETLARGALRHTLVEVYDTSLAVRPSNTSVRESTRGFIGRGSPHNPLVALPQNDTRHTAWAVFDSKGHHLCSIDVEPGDKVVGVGTLGSPGLFFVRDARLFHLSPTRRVQVLSVRSPIAKAEFSQVDPWVLITLSDGRHLLHDYAHERVIRKWGHFDE